MLYPLGDISGRKFGLPFRSLIDAGFVLRPLLYYMDYLRNLGTAAVSSLVQKSGLTLPFSLGNKVASYEGKSIWTLHEGTKRVRRRGL